jgi:FtsZ-binding cell division protein ZapB
VFDIFGEVVFRLNLADVVKTSDKARALYREWLESFDIVAHYREALESRAKRLESEARQYREALQALEPATA